MKTNWKFFYTTFSMLLLAFGAIAATGDNHTLTPQSSACPDLVLSSLVVAEYSDTKIEYRYQVTNVGTGPADLNGRTPQNADNVAIQLYLSKDGQVNSTNLPAGGTILNVSPLPILQPGESYIGTINLATNRDLTATPYLVVVIDPRNDLPECREQNNTAIAKINYTKGAVDFHITNGNAKWVGPNGNEVHIRPEDTNKNVSVELKSKVGGHTYIDFTNDQTNFPDFQSRIIANTTGHLYFQNRTPAGGFIMQNLASNTSLSLRGPVNARSSLFFENGSQDKRRIWELTARGLDYSAPSQRGQFLLTHHNGSKWVIPLSVEHDKETDFNTMTLSNKTSLKVGYLDPLHKDTRNGYEYIRLGTPQKYFGGFMWNHTNKYYGDGNDFAIFTYDNRDLVLRTSNSAKTLIYSGGVGIGTNKVPVNYKLAVDGKIICEELKVQLSQNWADYVFQKDYNLLTLEEVEQTIKEKGHLHNTPSAATIEAAGGIEVSKITVNQQEKIEEIYLHLIDMNKALKALQAENAALKTTIQELQNQ